jgi:hypothetical protein
MNVEPLPLGSFHLEWPSENLKVCVTSTADVKWPFSLLARMKLEHQVSALTSGYVWLSRGVRCQIDTQIRFNGNPLDSESRFRIREQLGQHVRDACVSVSTNLVNPGDCY